MWRGACRTPSSSKPVSPHRPRTLLEGLKPVFAHGAIRPRNVKVVPGGAPIEYALGPIAFSFGLAIMVLVFCTADISGGHLNPAVSFSFLVTGKQSPAEFVVYVIAQVLGANSSKVNSGSRAIPSMISVRIMGTNKGIHQTKVVLD